MRRNVGLLIVLGFVISMTACSGGPTSVQLRIPQEHGAVPFTATGVAVDEAVVCGSGTTTIDHLESIEGGTITDDDWAGMFDAAMADGGVAEMYVIQDFECGDGSGAFTMRFHNTFDFSTFEFEGQQDVGSWELTEGTGDFVDISGSGETTLDWDAGEAIFDGELETG